MRPDRLARGFTLLEVMIALSVLLVGLLGMMRLQIFGIQSNQGSRAQSTATQLARELGLALERLPFDDGLLQPGATGSTAPTPFGQLLNGTTVVSGTYRTWADSMQGQLPSVKPDAALERNPDGTPVYARRWTVWGYQPQPGPLAAKIIAVSVIFRERASSVVYETVYLTSVKNVSALALGALLTQ